MTLDWLIFAAAVVLILIGLVGMWREAWKARPRSKAYTLSSGHVGLHFWRKRRAVVLAVGLGLAVPSLASAIPSTLPVGFVTCIPDVGLGSCFDPGSPTAHWRVVNTADALTNFATPETFLDASLTFAYAGGSQTWTWPRITPTTGPGDFAETGSFPIGLVPSLVSLTFTATLDHPTLDPIWAGASACCLDGDRRFTESFAATSATWTDALTLATPWTLAVPGTVTDTLVPTPEPGTAWLLLTPAFWLMRRRR